MAVLWHMSDHDLKELSVLMVSHPSIPPQVVVNTRVWKNQTLLYRGQTSFER
jgi:hypothetical protein